MSQRKKTPDILGDLLGSKPVLAETVSEPVSPQAVLPAKHQSGIALRSQDTKTSSQQASSPVEQQTDKTTKPQEVLPAKQQNGITVSRQSALPTKLQEVKTSSRFDDLPAKRQAGKVLDEVDSVEPEATEVEAKTKMTFYLSEDSVELLEDAQRALRRMAKKAGKVQPKGITSKSALLEAALKLACDELEAKGEASHFASLIA